MKEMKTRRNCPKLLASSKECMMKLKNGIDP